MATLDLESREAQDISTFQLRDAADELMFAPPDAEGGDPVPVTVTVYGPGSKQYQAAQAAASRRTLALLQKKGKVTGGDTRTPEERIADHAAHLADITVGFSNLSYRGLQGRELAVGVYSNPKLGYIAQQVNSHAADWANFTKGSAKP